MDNLNMELPRKLDAATIAALFPDLDAVKSRVANWLRFLDRVSKDRNFPPLRGCAGRRRGRPVAGGTAGPRHASYRHSGSTRHGPQKPCPARCPVCHAGIPLGGRANRPGAATLFLRGGGVLVKPAKRANQTGEIPCKTSSIPLYPLPLSPESRPPCWSGQSKKRATPSA